jgi:hypothetical protein
MHQQLAPVRLGPCGELDVQRALWHVATSTTPVARNVHVSPSLLPPTGRATKLLPPTGHMPQMEAL